MVVLESAPEIAIGIAVEAVLFAIFAGVVYRVFSGKFLIPKREVVLPNQLGVIVQGDVVVRVAAPGICWVRPKQKVVLIDARPRPLQMAGMEFLGSDSGIIRLSVSGEFRVGDAGIYYSSSSNANDALYVQMRRLLSTVARRQPAAATISTPDTFAGVVRAELQTEAEKLGLTLTRLDVWDTALMGFHRQTEPETPGFEIPPSGGFIH
jgi:hypothetical protein